MFGNIYISELEIKNFRSLKNTSIKLQPGLNIIIGPNSSGKSNFLKSIIQSYRTFRTVFSPKSRQRGIIYELELILKSTDDVSQYIKFSTEVLSLDRDSIKYKIQIDSKTKNEILKENFELSNNNEIPIESEKIEQIRKTIRNWFIFPKLIQFVTPQISLFLSKPFSFKLNYSENGLTDIEDNFYNENLLNPNFDYLNVLYDTLEGNVRDIFLDFSIEPELKKNEKILNSKLDLIKEQANTFFEHLNLNLNKYTCIEEIRLNENIFYKINKDSIILENIILEFKINSEWQSWDYLSDGTKRLFFIFSEIISDIGRELILIEEPELGLHPEQIHKVMRFLKEISEDKQILISTHSPQILNVLEGNELNRIIISKYTNEGTKFNYLSKDKIKLIKEFLKEDGLYLSDFWVHGRLEENHD
ncbi:hypothetical protein BH10BAC5_BH10BAC5_04290 [soil metagenome]